ncbi:response regulator [Pleomorphovibrio marinus]|uniref:response regulator n=1 Tax=Pleomorphovibrio marinus TaxID=2164132 RepID=UPI000E0C170C|nr:response regulator [Pleomorphovibrio marinus]
MRNKERNIPVIIVDDEPGILFLHELMVAESKLTDQIFTFSNPKEGLDFIVKLSSTTTPLLIILDINMPVFDGWDILDKLDELNIPANVEVIMATSSIHKSDKEKSFLYKRVKMFFEKPIELEDCKRIRDELMNS